MAGPSLRPEVRIICPLCEERMRFAVHYREENSVNWVLAPISYAHLASCTGKEDASLGSKESRGHVRSAPDSREGTPSDQGPVPERSLQAA